MLPLALALAAAGTPAQGQRCAPEAIAPERAYAGVFVDEIEARRFFDGAQSMADVDRRDPDRIWMDLDVVGMGKPFGIESRPQQAAYRVRFVGIKRTRGSAMVPCGYGHFNGFTSDMRVVRLLAIEPIPLGRDRPR